MKAYRRNTAGLGVSTEYPEMDFETYSEAGYVFDGKKWNKAKKGSNKASIGIVGSAVYSEHPSTEILSLAYDLKDSLGPRVWAPGSPPPLDLFAHVKSGGVIEAWNSIFEYFIWNNVAVNRLGWPQLDIEQLRDAAAKCRAFGGPGGLEVAAKVFKSAITKDADGKRLIKKFCIPRNPSKKDQRKRIKPTDDLEDMTKLLSYNVDDIRSESGVSKKCPDLSPFELRLWLLDQEINTRGVHIDKPLLYDCLDIVKQAILKYTQELQTITLGKVDSPNARDQILKFISRCGINMPNLQKETVDDYLKRDDIQGLPRRVLEIRQLLGSAAVKKTESLRHRICSDGRVRDIFVYCGAGRTGRWSGSDPQPHNFTSKGVSVKKCGQCGSYCGAHRSVCPWCSAHSLSEPKGWTYDAVEDVRLILRSRDLTIVEMFFGDPLDTVSGILRALICAAPGYDFVCSDFSAIEAVVLAFLAGEQWRMEVFRTHGKIYEASASAITGVPLEEFFDHKARTGEHHPYRKLGKVAELASGYAGWIGAWKNFGADKYLGSDREIQDNVLSWRKASPSIVELWGGQIREYAPYQFRREFFGLEGAAVHAILNPGKCFGYKGITYGVRDDVLYCRLPSGRYLHYHQPRLRPDVDNYSKMPILKITYWGYTNGKWELKDTYGGKLTENVIQAIARDILGVSMLNVSEAGYPIVMHVHDEIVTEVLEGFGSVGELEQLMMVKASWYTGWAIKAAGGYRGKFFKK